MLFAAGCSSSANKKLDEFADRACACSDEACAKRVEDDFQKWLADNKDATGDEEKAKKSATRMMGCIMKARLGKMGEKMEKMDKEKGEKMDKAEEKAADKPADEKAADKPADSK